MRVKTILFVLLIMTPLAINIDQGDCDCAKHSKHLANISELSSIEISLAWEPQFDATSFLDLFIKPCYAALPPRYQPHYKHTLTFNHDDKTISDVFKKFTGEDPSSIKISEVKRDTAVYEKFKGLLTNTAFLCEVATGNEGWVGPTPPEITFHKADGSVLKAYFYDCPMCQKGDLKLCSREFSQYLLSLQANR